ncbi:MAG: endonuclease domain-containing protein [Patescibacteria group bacterium]
MNMPSAPSNSPINGGEQQYKNQRLPGKRYRGVVTHLQRQKEMRKGSTPAEHALWQHLRKRQLDNLKFRRQHGIGPYIVDFYCDQCKLIIEVDGDIHNKPEIGDYDRDRQEQLEELGYTIIRVRNEAVLKNIELVLKNIKDTINQIT